MDHTIRKAVPENSVRKWFTFLFDVPFGYEERCGLFCWVVKIAFQDYSPIKIFRGNGVCSIGSIEKFFWYRGYKEEKGGAVTAMQQAEEKRKLSTFGPLGQFFLHFTCWVVDSGSNEQQVQQQLCGGKSETGQCLSLFKTRRILWESAIREIKIQNNCAG